MNDTNHERGLIIGLAETNAGALITAGLIDLHTHLPTALSYTTLGTGVLMGVSTIALCVLTVGGYVRAKQEEKK